MELRYSAKQKFAESSFKFFNMLQRGSSSELWNAWGWICEKRYNYEQTLNNIAILFAKEVLQNKGLIARLSETEREGRLWLSGQLKAAGYRTLALEGNYVLFYPKRDSGAVVEALKEKKVWVRDYGRGVLKGWIRVSTGAKRCMERFWEALLQVDGQ